jgi:hypothetical protein
MLGREVYTPLDMCLDLPPGEPEPFKCMTQYAEWLRDTIRSCHETARQNIDAASQTQKHQYNEGKKHMPLPVGSWVWKKINVPHSLKPKWDGPWLIVAHMSDVVYRIEKANGERKHTHLDNLKPYSGETPPAWVETRKSKEVACQTDDPPGGVDDADSESSDGEEPGLYQSPRSTADKSTDVREEATGKAERGMKERSPPQGRPTVTRHTPGRHAASVASWRALPRRNRHAHSVKYVKPDVARMALLPRQSRDLGGR